MTELGLVAATIVVVLLLLGFAILMATLVVHQRLPDTRYVEYQSQRQRRH